MEWKGRRGSSNVQDRRRVGSSGAAVGGVGGVGVLAIVVIGYFLGVDLTPMLGGGGVQSGGGEVTAADEERADFVSVTLADTEEVWGTIFRDDLGQTYPEPQLVLFKGAVQSGCGGASSATGPFYCPADRSVYLDTDFFVVMEEQLGAGGDFAAAYVVAHEVGHHVQNVLGILGEAQRGSRQGADSDAVRVELQADCFAGVWANRAQDLAGLDRADIAEAMNAAEQIGDDTLQSEAGQVVRPDAFTHGTADQRERWFLTGYERGDVEACNTFEAARL